MISDIIVPHDVVVLSLDVSELWLSGGGLRAGSPDFLIGIGGSYIGLLNYEWTVFMWRRKGLNSVDSIIKGRLSHAPSVISKYSYHILSSHRHSLSSGVPEPNFFPSCSPLDFA